MSDERKEVEEQTSEILQALDLPVTIHAQYIRDLSFENPQAPASLRAGQTMPEMNVNIGMDARLIEDDKMKNLYEVALTISATAERDGKSVFIGEIIYGVTVSIGDVVPEDQHHPLLLIEIPKYSFPFARQILATLTSQGGYPPLLLNPVDFQALYMERFKAEMKEAHKAEEEAEAAAAAGQTN
ncbi:MAG: protein-export chaperone SecB [Alphaproteobacteria bacterium]